MLSELISGFLFAYNENNGFLINEKSTIKDILPRLYLFYQHFNGDETMADEIEKCIVDSNYLQAIVPSELEEETFDLIHVIDNETLMNDNIETVSTIINGIDDVIAQTISGIKNQKTIKIREFFNELMINESKNLRVTILTHFIPIEDDKSYIKDIVTNYFSKIPNLNYMILFGDDISEIIREIESPTMYVKSGSLLLTDKDQLFFHGEERSLVTSIGAKSLKNLYLKYGSNGLFASNLRFYVKSSKIDASIKDSIIHSHDKFWYFNNGIIITCEDYTIKKDEIFLKNFSIVNGGQTTNLIGNSVFENDFSLICKIIKNKYKDPDKNLEFLAKIAETSNTQKPIKVKDLIANRVEQRKLKQQYKEINVYLHVKRGEKINKQQYPEKWQNATNDEVGQMLFSFVYQRPGNAKNAKSAMLQNEKNYKIIYQDSYNSQLLLGFQYLKVAFNDWKNKIKKEQSDLTKLGFATNGFFMTYAIIGFFAKVFINSELREYIMELYDIKSINSNEQFKRNISQNDIGNTKVFFDVQKFRSKNYAFTLFDFLYNTIIKKSFENFKKKYPNFSAAHFSKSDTNYYDNVLAITVEKIQNDWDSKFKVFLSEYYIYPGEDEKIGLIDEEDYFEEYKPGLIKELEEYRKRKYADYNGKIEAYKILKNNQISQISVKKPRTIEDLIKDIKFSQDQAKYFGEDIIKIIAKYSLI